MPVKIEEVSACKRKMIFEIPQSEIQEKIDKSVDELMKTVAMPGFRPGHAPRRLVERKMGQEIRDQAKVELITENYQKAVEENKLEIMREDDFNPDSVELPTDGPLTFEFNVEVKPLVDLPDYSAPKLQVRKITVEDTDLEQSMSHLQRSRGRFVEQPAEAVIQERDMLTADVRIAAGDIVLHEQNDSQLAVFVQSLGGVRLENLVSALEGKKSGDTVTFDVAVPEDFENKDVAGKTATATVTVKSVRRIDLPELNDELAKSVGFESLDEMRKAVKERLERDADEARQNVRRMAVADWLLKEVPLEVPEGSAEAGAARLFNQQVVNLQMRGVPVEMIQNRAEDLQATSRNQARTELQLSLILEALAKKENIEVSDDEIEARVAMMARNYNRSPDKMYEDLMKRGQLDSVREQIRDDKAMALLLERAEFTEVEQPAEDADKTEAGKVDEGAKKSKKTKKAKDAADTEEQKSGEA